MVNFVRQRGSHLILEKSGAEANLSVPNHRELSKGTLNHLIKLAGLDVP
jgi:predicted RNA binding protein YcfA (HicA-like mRNA interferase family)